MIKSIYDNVEKFGEHLVFDAYGCSFEKLNSSAICEETLLQLAKLAKMNKLIDPVIVHAVGNETLGGKDPGGYSGFLIIQESHISIHTFAKRGYVTIDIYSCKQFEHKGITEYLIEQFDAKDYDVLKLDRGLKYPAENIY